MHKWMIGVFVSLLLVFAVAGVSGTEYFVGIEGGDTNDGRSAAQAFRTVQHGVDALAEGDTLTILPGEYFETVFRKDLGGPERETVIRAAIPGTVLLRGDVPAPPFQPVAGYRFVHQAEFDRPVQAVNERDTLRILESAAGIAELEFVPGAFYHDAERGRLYISSSDLAPPQTHTYTVSVLGSHGLCLDQPRRVTVEGLAATGFNSAEILPMYPGYRTAWGIAFARATDSTIRNCSAFLNGGGIMLFTSYAAPAWPPGRGNVIEHGRAWANHSRYCPEGGNIMGFSVNDDVIRDSVTHSSGRHGIRLYGGIGPGLIDRCMGWGNAGGSEGRNSDLFIKGGVLHEQGLARRSIAVGAGHIAEMEHCLIGGENAYHRDIETPRDTIRLEQEPDLDRDREFADPDTFDFRLQADSRFRGTGPDGADRGPHPYEANIFYVRPDGDDEADGLAISRARRTPAHAAAELRGGDTLYLSPGEYGGGLEIALQGNEAAFIRGRGLTAPVITGAVRVTGSGPVVFERIRFAGPVHVEESRGVVFRHCSFAAPDEALSAVRAEGLRVEHGHFDAGGLNVAQSSAVYLSGNLFEGESGAAVQVDDAASILYSDYHAYASTRGAWKIDGAPVDPGDLRGGMDRYSSVGLSAIERRSAGPMGKAVGPYQAPRERPLRAAGLFLHGVSRTTADIEWWSSRMTGCEISWGPVGRDEMQTRAYEANGFTTFSLTGLDPDTEYMVRIRFRESFEIEGVGGDGKGLELAFRTAAADRDPVIWHVAPDGDDAADGQSRAQAFRTVNAAAARTRAGDTVLVHAGRYSETVRIRSTGTAERPVTFRSAPGEKVVFDGADRVLEQAFIIAGKQHVHVDGFYFRGFGVGGEKSRPFSVSKVGVIMVYASGAVRVTRCFKDGRGAGYSPNFVAAWKSPDLLIRNCVMAVGFTGFSAANCPGLRLEHNVFLRNMIQAAIVVNAPDQPFTLTNNIITDSGANKSRTTLLEIGRVESMIERDNQYVLRLSDEEKRLFMFYGGAAYARTIPAYDLPPHDAPPVFTELTRSSLAAYQAQFGDTGSAVGDAAFRIAREMPRENAEGQPIFIPDRVIGIPDLDFPDLFTMDPDLVRREIGLRPADFEDFHFVHDR